MKTNVSFFCLAFLLASTGTNVLADSQVKPANDHPLIDITDPKPGQEIFQTQEAPNEYKWNVGDEVYSVFSDVNTGNLFVTKGQILDIKNNIAKFKWLNGWDKTTYESLPFRFKAFPSDEEAKKYINKRNEEKFNER